MVPLPDLSTASREELIALVLAYREQGMALEARIAELERQQKAGGPPHGMPGNKPAPTPKPEQRGGKPRKRRTLSFVRRRSEPTREETHAVAACPDCGTPLAGGWVQRTREVIELPPAKAEVIRHNFVSRICADCGKRVTAKAAVLNGVVVGRQRLGVRLVSLLVTLREAARLPIGQIRELVRTLYQLDLSEGAIVAASARVATAGTAEVAGIQVEIQNSPTVHSDETGWRENGRNGYVWTLSTPTARYFHRGDRSANTFKELLGPDFAGILVSDFYGVYTSYEGMHQYCWAHLLREVHDLCVQWPAHPGLQVWAAGVKAVYRAGVATIPLALGPPERRAERLRLEQALLTLGQPVFADPNAPHLGLAKRIEKYVGDLLTFVEHPSVPPDNNAAERSLRHLVVQRKISGGTRSPAGTTTKMALATLFGTWQLRGLDPMLRIPQLLVSPQP